MKTLKKTIWITLVVLFVIGSPGCLIFETTPRHDHGNHNGWYKNPHNPHHPDHHHHNHRGKH